MNVLLLLIGFAIFLLVVARLTRVVARDGLGSGVVPRSHRDELGGWAAQELRR